MSGTRPGRQPVPQRVYWVRRLVVLGLPLVLVVLVVWLLAGRGAAAGDDGPVPTAGSSGTTGAPGADDGAGSSGTAGDADGAGDADKTGDADRAGDADEPGDADETEGAADSATTPPGGIPECGPKDLSVVTAASEESFAAGVSPTFTVTLKNTGAQPCVVDAGQEHQEVVVTSGDDRVWSSRDCPGDGADSRVLLLDTGAEDAQQLAWNRVRSAEGCPDGLPAPKAGTYSVAVTVGGVAADPVVFGLG